MSTQVMLNVTFQSKVGDGLECSPEKILLHAADMKALKLKVGGAVLVQMPSSQALCRAWASKKAVVGSATLNKLWAANFPADVRKIKVSLMTHARSTQCASITFSIVGKSSTDNLVTASAFRDLLKAMITNTPLTVGLLLSFTLRCQYYILKVEGCQTDGDRDAAAEPAVAGAFYTVSANTKVTIQTVQSKSNALANSNIISDGIGTGKQRMDTFVAAMRGQFAGYQSEAIEALGTVCLGLGGPYQLTSANSNVSSGSKPLYRPPKGIILHGPPGTGKTCLMRGLVSALGCEHVELSHNILLSSYEGEAERAVTRVFQEAVAKAPCCVLIDNMDLLCYSRTAAGASELQKRIVACLLTLMDGLGGSAGGEAASAMQGVFVIGTTARIGDIDPAIRRAGRIDKEIEIGVPSSSDRESILLYLLRRAGANVPGLDGSNSDGSTMLPLLSVQEVANLAHGMVGSDLLSVVKEAAYLTLRDRIASLEAGAAGMPGFDTDVRAAADTTSMTPIKGPTGTNIAQPESDEGMDQLVGSLVSEFEDLDVDETEEAPAKYCEPTETVEANLAITDTTGNDSAKLVTTAGSSMVIGRDEVITEAALRRAVSKISPSALREVVIEVPSVRWTDIGGMDGVKQSLREVVEWPLLHPQLFATLGISPPKGVLLYGPPGCSKTLMAKALATESSMNFLAVRGPELLSKWLGESEKAVQALFRRARAAAPSIVFFDEIDALAGKRGDVSSGVSDRVLSQLLTELDGVHGLKQVIVIAATNRPDMLDAALVRPGRIDRKIYVPPPDEASREQILKLELKKMPLEGEFDFQQLVARTAGFSGAEIVGACSEAAMLAIEEECAYLHPEHLLTAVRSVKPQITETMLQFYKSCAANL